MKQIILLTQPTLSELEAAVNAELQQLAHVQALRHAAVVLPEALLGLGLGVGLGGVGPVVRDQR
jgi:hypothetical protein